MGGLLLRPVMGRGGQRGREETARPGFKPGSSLAVQWLLRPQCTYRPVPELQQAHNSKGLPVSVKGYGNLTQFAASLNGSIENCI